MQINVTTPALLFPAISLFMLAFTNRFLSLGARIRSLHDAYLRDGGDSQRRQIQNLRVRVRQIQAMQGLGIVAMCCCVGSMVALFMDLTITGQVFFGLSLAFLLGSLVVSFMEIRISMRALEILIEDMEGE
ncbi:DUF2721 domain-containing protein [Desulfocurvus sp. DL9XJH121]